MKDRRCGGSKVLVSARRGVPAVFGQDKVEPCPGCPDCFSLLTPDTYSIGKYLTVQRYEVLGRTMPCWRVRSEDGTMIGAVRWWGPWRQYTFQPEPSTVFHDGCLRDIASFMKRVNDLHRAEVRARKAGVL